MPRKRESSDDYAGRLLEAQREYAESATSDPLAIGALEIAAGIYGRAFAAATVDGPRAATLTPQLLSEMARAAIRHGEHVSVIEVSGGMVELLPTSWHYVYGDASPSTWDYQVTIPTPVGTSTRNHVPGAGIVHLRYATDPARPWAGTSPLQWAAQTGKLAANLERVLAEETGGSVGWLLPIPSGFGATEEDNDPTALLKADLANLKGKTALVETMEMGWQDNKIGKPASDWNPRRFGADPPGSLPTLRDAVTITVLNSCGIPSGLVQLATTTGTATREAWRQLLHGALNPLASLFEYELSQKLDSQVRIRFDKLKAADVVGTARAAASLAQASMPERPIWTKEEAEGITGLMG